MVEPRYSLCIAWILGSWREQDRLEEVIDDWAEVGGRRAKFSLESVLDLKFSLKSISSDLLVSIDRLERVFRGNILFLPMP